ncbi:MAG: hypothetical protein WD771_10345 [Gemmatimonadaceae bacterium]
MLPSPRLVPLAVALCAAAAPLVAQPPVQPARSLPAPDATFEEPFSSIAPGTIRELRDGRLIVADARDKVVQLIDFRTGSATAIGREGSGPGEFGMPMRLFPAANDTTFLFDPLNTRYLVIGPDGKPVTTFRVEEESSSGGGVRMRGMIFARGSDGDGRLYAETPGFSMGPDGRPQSADSSALIRWDRVTKRTDTLTWVKLQKQNVEVSGGQGNMRMMIGGSNPLTPRDEWAVFPDGRVAVVRADGYRVDWIQPNGTRQSSGPIRYTPIRITDADKREEEALRLRARANQMTVSMDAGPGGTRRSASVGPGANAPPPPPLTDWPDVKPPFRPGMASVWARPNGELWVRRTEPAGAKGTLYDVINRQGVVTHQVRLGEGLTLVGFGNGTIYTTTLDEDDLVYLQRHAVPEQALRG